MSGKKLALRGQGFTFKQFFIAHDKCAMKVGTDGILLGSWAPALQVDSVLDIGCGTGLLAVMLAQRTSQTTQIDAVELDAVAAKQAYENVQASPWSARITLYQADVRHWTPPLGRQYSLIISNPPYYEKGVACSSSEREQARYTTTLSYQALLICAQEWITAQGMFCLVLPVMTSTDFIKQAEQSGWHVRLRTEVTETEGRAPHRVLLALSLQAGTLTETTLVIRDQNKDYSAAFCQLTRDFYLSM